MFDRNHEIEFAKEDEQHLVTAWAYSALGKNHKDSQGEYVGSIRDLEEAAHSFAENGLVLKLDHEIPISPERAAVVESFVTHEQTRIGTRDIPRGSFVVRIKVKDPDLWNSIKAGDFKAVSIGGKCKKSADGRISDLNLKELSLVKQGAFLGTNVVALKSAEPQFTPAEISKLKQIADMLKSISEKLPKTTPAPARQEQTPGEVAYSNARDQARFDREQRAKGRRIII